MGFGTRFPKGDRNFFGTNGKYTVDVQLNDGRIGETAVSFFVLEYGKLNITHLGDSQPYVLVVKTGSREKSFRRLLFSWGTMTFRDEDDHSVFTEHLIKSAKTNSPLKVIIIDTKSENMWSFSI